MHTFIIVWNAYMYTVSMLRIRPIRKKTILVTVVVLAPVLILGVYVLSVVWRTSVAMHRYYGRSDLIPFSSKYPKYAEAPVATSYGSPTFKKPNTDGKVIVWRQKVNGFQHMFGSALAAYELGVPVADKLFCANEFAEFTCDWNGVQADDLLDRKKDLANNAIGRKIGARAKAMGLHGREAELYIAESCFDTAEHNPDFLPHFLDPRVASLTEEKLGCHFLPKQNLFNWLQRH